MGDAYRYDRPIVGFLTATAISVILFERLRIGTIPDFIVAGIIIGSHIPGPVPVHAVEELQIVAKLGMEEDLSSERMMQHIGGTGEEPAHMIGQEIMVGGANRSRK